MTPSEAIKIEEDEIVSRTGRYIPPWHMANLLVTAQRVANLLVKGGVCTTYEECEIVLDVVRTTIYRATGKM